MPSACAFRSAAVNARGDEERAGTGGGGALGSMDGGSGSEESPAQRR